MSERRIAAMLVALAAATFVVSSSSSGMAPFLTGIARDLGTGLPAVANLFSIQAIVWGATSLLAGTASDRLGRRVLLVAGIAILGATRLGFAASHTYLQTVVWQVISGVGGGAFMGAVFATVSDHVPIGTRGRALSWVISGQSLSLVLGVPLLTLLGALGGWRGAVAVHGLAVIAVAIAVRFAVPPDLHRDALPRAGGMQLRAVARPRLLSLLAAGVTERVCFASLVIYLPTFFQRAYDVAFGPLALVLALVAVGNLVGNILGGRVADRARARGRVFAITSFATAMLALPTLMLQPGLAASVALGFAFSFVNAAGRPSLMTALSEVPSELRGTVFGLTVTMASVGWLLAGSLGAVLVAAGGFSVLGLFCAGLAATGGALALAAASGAEPLRKPA